MHNLLVLQAPESNGQRRLPDPGPEAPAKAHSSALRSLTVPVEGGGPRGGGSGRAAAKEEGRAERRGGLGEAAYPSLDPSSLPILTVGSPPLACTCRPPAQRLRPTHTLR